MNLQSLLSQPKAKSPLITIAGEAGTGKTSLGAEFHNPVFLRIEDGSAALEGKDVALSPVIENIEQVHKFIHLLQTEDHNFKTLVIDSISQLDEIFKAHIMGLEKPGSKGRENFALCCGGFGNAYTMLAKYHEDFYHLLSDLSAAKGMTIVFISHVVAIKVSPPDQNEYTRYALSVTRTGNIDCAKVYVNNCDLIGFLKQISYVNEHGKISTDATRILDCTHNLQYPSKNRYGIDRALPYKLGENPLANSIPYFQNQSNTNEQSEVI